MKDGNDLKALELTARKLARKNGRIYFVIREHDHTGLYHVCDDYDLETFYAGTRDSNILYCTAS